MLPPEQQAIRDKCFHPSGTFVEFPMEEVETSIPARFEKIVRMYPDRLAVKNKDRSQTYNELNKAANQIACAILEKRGQGSEPIALLFEHGIDVVAAILGVLKAGKFYVALDPSFPDMRVARILEDCDAKLIVTNEQKNSLAHELSQNRLPVVNIDANQPNLSGENPDLGISADAFAYVIYTSGSTGPPKGVIQNHRHVLHNIMPYTNCIHVCAEDRLTFLNSSSSAAGVRNIFGALLNGSGLFSFDLRREALIDLAVWLAREQVTICHAMTSVFRSIVEVLSGNEKFTGLRLLELAGESLSAKDINLYRSHFLPKCVFAHSMGATEVATARWYFIGDLSQRGFVQAPVGYGVADKEVLLLDDNGKELGYNQIGEIAVKSRYLSPGYWRNADLTRTKFLLHPNGDERLYLTGDLGRMLPDGCLEYIGRKDFRAKIRGFTVDPTEVEIALLQHSQVQNAAVVTRNRESGENYLVAYIVPSGNSALRIEYLRDFLREHLPDHMIPLTFVFLESLPLTNGKLDPTGLPLPDDKRSNLEQVYAPPRGEIEIRLAQIWEEILDVRPIGIHDNFFNVGGHSLAASRVISRVIQTFQLELPIKALFDAPTVAEMAAIIAQNQTRRASNEELAQMLNEVEAMSEEEAQQLVAKEAVKG